MRLADMTQDLPEIILQVSKARLDGALSNLVWWEVSLPVAEGWNWMILTGPFQPKP